MTRTKCLTVLTNELCQLNFATIKHLIATVPSMIFVQFVGGDFISMLLRHRLRRKHIPSQRSESCREALALSMYLLYILTYYLWYYIMTIKRRIKRSRPSWDGRLIRASYRVPYGKKVCNALLSFVKVDRNKPKNVFCCSTIDGEERFI